VVMTLFSEELEHNGPGAKNLVGELLESKDTWENVSYENSAEHNVSYSCTLFETEVILYRHILCILWRNHVTHIPESSILQRRGWMRVTKILQLKMVLGLFSIKALEGRLDCGHCIPNLMQFLKLWPIQISIFESWMLFWKDLLQKLMINTNPDQYILKHHNLK